MPAASATAGSSSAAAGSSTYYKVVAEVNGKYLSIFDGRTEYKLRRTTAPPDGCWVSPSLTAVTQHALRLPLRSALLDVPRVILRVSGWNASGIPPRIPDGHPALTDADNKLLVSHVMPVDVLPYEAIMQAAGLAQAVQRPTTAQASPRTSPAISIADLISSFDAAFPNLSHHLLRCAGQLAVNCGARAYDRTAWITFHSCGELFTPAPIVVRILPLDASTARRYSLDAALRDVEAVLHWMVHVAGGPTEVALAAPDGAFWDSIELASTRPMASNESPRRVRDNASPLAALVAPATWAGETAFRMVDVPCTGTYASYAAAERFPRLHALVAATSSGSLSGAPASATRPSSAPPAAAAPAAAPAADPTAASPSAVSPRSLGAARAHAAVESARVRGFTVGTAWAASGMPCAELVAARRTAWAHPCERMHSVAATLACLELQLPRASRESERHAATMRKLSETERARRGAAPRDAKRHPSPRSLSDVFPADRLATPSSPRERHMREDPEDYDASCRKHRAKLFAHAAFRRGVAFDAALLEAKAKQAAIGSVLDELDMAVLSAPAWKNDAPPAAANGASPRRWY